MSRPGVTSRAVRVPLLFADGSVDLDPFVVLTEFQRHCKRVGIDAHKLREGVQRARQVRQPREACRFRRRLPALAALHRAELEEVKRAKVAHEQIGAYQGERREALVRIAEALLERETLERSELEALLGSVDSSGARRTACAALREATVSL